MRRIEKEHGAGLRDCDGTNVMRCTNPGDLLAEEQFEDVHGGENLEGEYQTIANLDVSGGRVRRLKRLLPR